jgi:hypothetical protein
MGPGVDVTNPGESRFIPIDAILGPDTGVRASELSHVTDAHLLYARQIPSPGDRSLALSRIASAATFSAQLDMAEVALNDSATAALEMTPGLIQDQRLMSIIGALIGLVEARLRDGANEPSLPIPGADANANPNAPPNPNVEPAPLLKLDRNDIIRKAQADARRAGDLAARVNNATYRAEMMSRVADTLGLGSQQIVNEFPRDEASERDASGLVRSYQGLPDQMLQDAAAIASRIERPVWHDQALVRVATSAAESKQFSRALRVSRLIPNPEVRTNALLKIGEIQAQRGDPDGATSTYREAAVSVASIPQEDPRAVLAGVLIDNLISLGRFEDARASIVLYPDEPRQVIALGAIAESMGRRGAGRSALAWINRDVPDRYRSWLYRKVNNGVVAAIENNRSRDLTNRER